MRWLPWIVLAAMLGVTLALLPDDGPGASGAFPVSVDGPDGPIWNGTVEVEDATALQVLLATQEPANMEVVVEGTGANAFVTSIAGYENAGAGGWCVAVWNAGWTYPFEGADSIVLDDRQATRWTYHQGGCPF